MAASGAGGDLLFNACDWCVQHLPYPGRSCADEQVKGAYDEWSKAGFTAFVFGADAEGRSVALKITGFKPYFYVRVPDEWTDGVREAFAAKVDEDCSGRNGAPPKVTHAHVRRRDMWGFAGGRRALFVKFKCSNMRAFNRARACFDKPRRERGATAEAHARAIEAWLATPRGQVRTYEASFPPLLRLMHDRDLGACGWLRVRAGAFEPTVEETTCARNYVARAKDVFPDTSIMRLAPLRIASFDIECTSEHGDFPQAIKTYRKLAGDLYMNRRRIGELSDAAVTDAVLAAFARGDVVPKDRTFASASAAAGAEIRARLARGGIAAAIFDVLRGGERSRRGLFDLVGGAQKMVRLAERYREMLTADDLAEARAALRARRIDKEDYEGEEGRTRELEMLGAYVPRLVRRAAAAAPAAAAAAAAAAGDGDGDGDDGDAPSLSDPQKERAIYLLDGMLTAALPELEGDAIINVSTTVHRFGVDGIESRHSAALARNGMATLNPVLGIAVSICRTEREVIEAWVAHVADVDPSVLCGYNIFGFDWDYLWDRAGECGAREALVAGLSRLQSARAEFKRVWSSSSAMGDNYNKYLAIPGRMSVDLMKHIQRDKQLDSYKLDSVAQEFLGDSKHDLSPQEIFKKFKSHAPEELRTIAEYCVQDCELVNRLVVKLRVIEGQSQMANVCHVPMSFIFMRGQGIKIYALVVYTGSSLGVVLPTVRPCEAAGCLGRPAFDYPATWEERNKRRDRRCARCRLPGMTVVLPDRENDDEARGDTAYGGVDKYEGAIVLDPKPCMYLDEPITVLDYNSLYPSSMISENLCPSTIVLNEARYGALPDTRYNVVTVEGVQHKFVVPDPERPETKGVLPIVLERLLKARKDTRKMMEYVAVVLREGGAPVEGLGSNERRLVGLPVAATGTEPGGMEALLDVLTGRTFTFPTADVVSRGDAFDAFEKAVLDGRQLGQKTTANSLYGQTGALTSAISMRAIAACTTAVGRAHIIKAKAFVENQYGAEVVYGDSIMPRTPVTVLRSHVVEAVAAEDLVPAGQWQPYPGLLKRGSGKEQHVPAEGALSAWTPRGWSPVLRVIRHLTTKAIWRVSVAGGGVVDVTADHSLLRADGALVAPVSLRVGDALLHSPVSAEDAVAAGATFLTAEAEGVFDVYEDDDGRTRVVALTHVGAQNAVLRLLGKGYRFDGSAPHVDSAVARALGEEFVTVTMLPPGSPMAPPAGRVTGVELIHAAYTGQVYDLETEEGVFAAGVGDLVAKNTDSIFIKFPLGAMRGREALIESIKRGQDVERTIVTILKPPQKLAYEKTLMPFIIISKKRYVGLLYETDPDHCKLKYMGLALKRRDQAPITKKVFRKVLDAILYERDVGKGVERLREELDAIQAGHVDLADLVITKTLKAEYKDPTRIAHKVLAERMGERDPGNKPAVNERIPYVFVAHGGGKNVLQGERIESPAYVRANNLPLDYGFYISNQIMVPVSQLLALALEKLPGYRPPPPAEGEWSQDRKLVETQFLLFYPYLPNTTMPGCAARIRADKKEKEEEARRPPPFPRVRVAKDGAWEVRSAAPAAALLASGPAPAGSSRETKTLLQLRGVSEALDAVLGMNDVAEVVVLSETAQLHKALSDRTKNPPAGCGDVLQDIDDSGIVLHCYRDEPS